MIDITLKCFNCGKTQDVTVSRLPTFAFEIAQIANESGMYGVLDNRNHRALVFCNQECASQQKTKQGYYRVKPLRKECS